MAVPSRLLCASVALLCACPPLPLDPIVSTASTGAATASDDTTVPVTTSDAGTSTGPDPGTTGEPGTTSETTGGTTTTGASETTADPDTGAASTGPVMIDCTELALDPVLLAEVRQKLEIPEGPISGEAALAVTGLYVVGDEPVQTLAGVECLQNLRVLSLWNTTVTDLGPVAALGQLQGLTLLDSEVTDLGPLVGLPIEHLDLHGAPLADISLLAQMPQLTHLGIGATAVMDLTPLTGLPNLVHVTASETLPLDLLPLATLPKLEDLRIGGCSLADISALAGATTVRELTVEDNQLTDLGGLEGMQQLEQLYADNNKIATLAALAGKTKLADARLSNNKISDLEPLAGAAALGTLYVDDNPLAGLEGLEQLSLGYLSAERCGLTELVAVAPQSLEGIDLNDNDISDLTPFAGHTALASLGVDDNAVKTLKPIESAPWVLAGCHQVSIKGNPLDAATLETVLPAMCGLDMTIDWDQGECAPEGFRCGVSDP